MTGLTFDRIRLALDSASPPSKATAEQWLGMIRNAAGVNPEEVQWLGLRGTEINPTSLANRKLVTRGPYQFTRNPMYLGLVTLSLRIAVWIGAWPMFMAPLAAFATVNWGHVPFEEAKMRRQFGAAYDDYVARVRRWV
jgi:protein-S-isoprenylcysteine O-methyltransferase Ste14